MAKGNGECPIFKIKRKRANGEEYFIYAFDLVNPDGKINRYTSRVGEKKGDFKKRKTKIMQQHQNTVHIKDSFVTIKTFINNWLVQKRDIAGTTKKVYQDYLNSYVKPFIGDIKLNQITVDDINDLFTTLQDTGGITHDKDGNEKRLNPLSPASLRKVKFILKQIFDYAIEQELLAKNPMRSIKLPKIEKPPMKPLTTDEMSRLLEVAKGTPMYAAIYLDLSTGLRRGELLGLQWSDIDLDTGIANIHRQLVPVTGGVEIKDTLKTDNAERQIVIPSKVLTVLKEHKNQQELDSASDNYYNSGNDYNLVIRQSNGKHYHPRNFARTFDKLLAKAGLEKRKIQDMRHTFATQLLTNGVYVSEVQMSLGHSDAKTTLQNYAHILPGRQKEVANKMNELLP